MSLKIGDTYFDRHGRAAVVVDKDPVTSELVLERQGENFEKSRSLGVINGLKKLEREQFQEIMKDVRSEQDPAEQIKKLTDKIQELNENPKNIIISRYLVSEKAHIMNTERLNPRTFVVEEDSIR